MASTWSSCAALGNLSNSSISSSDKPEKVDLFGKQLCMHIAALNPISVDINGISNEIIEKEHSMIFLN